jgi:hypothetical protein
MAAKSTHATMFIAAADGIERASQLIGRAQQNVISHKSNDHRADVAC